MKKITKTLLPILLILLITTAPITIQTTKAQETNTWKQKLIEKGFIKSGPHGLAIDTWTYLYGKTQEFINHLTLQKNLNGTKKENSATIYGHALTLKDAEQKTQKIQKNHIKDARNLVWTKIKKATIKSLNNGRTKQYAKVHTKQIIQNYYSTIQHNLNQQLNTEINTLRHLTQKNQNTTTLHKNPFLVYGKAKYTSWGRTHTITKTKPLEFYKRNISLLNNTKQTITDIKEIKIPRERYSHGKIQIDGATYSDESPVTGDGAPGKATIIAKPVLGDRETIIDSMEWKEIHDLVKKENNRMIDNAKKYIDGVYEEYQKNEITTKDLIDAETLVTELNTEINKTGYFGYSYAKLALLGINTSLDGKITIKLNKTNETLTGMLFTDHSPKNNTYRVGETYYPNNWTKPCYFLTKELRTLNQPFKVKEIVDYNGTKHAEVDLNNYNQQTLDPNNLKNELNQLNQLYNKTSTLKQNNSNGNGFELKDPFKGLSEIELDFGFNQTHLVLLVMILFFLAVIAVNG